MVAIPQAPPAPPKRKHTLLPVLIVLFLISYGLMCTLAVEQDGTTASQRWLIRSLLSDSSELSSIKGKMVQKQYADAQAQAKARIPLPGANPVVPGSNDPGSNDPGSDKPRIKRELPPRAAIMQAKRERRCRRNRR